MSDHSLHEACGRGDLEAVRAILAADPAAVDADDQHQWRPIFHAALWRREAVVRLLIEAGADLAAHDGYVLHYAGEVPDNQAIVSLLLQHGALEAHARPADDLSRQFLAAVFLADTARVRALTALHPHLPTTVDGRGDQPLHHACRNGATEVVRCLLDAGADVNARGADGNPPLFCAGGHRHIATMRLLLDAAADPAAPVSHAGKTLAEWLAQFPGDKSFAAVAEALREHATGA